MQILRKADLAAIFLFVLLAVFLAFAFAAAGASAGSFATVSVDGVVVLTIDLTQNEGERFEIPSPGGINEVLVEGGAVRMIYADCPDQHCVRMGAISGAFQTITCLPNRVVVEIETQHYGRD